MGKGILFLVLTMSMFVGYLSPEEVKADRNNFDYKEEIILIDNIAEENTREDEELARLREELSRREKTGFMDYTEYVYKTEELIDTQREYRKEVETEKDANRLEVIEQEITRRLKKNDNLFGQREWVASQWSADLFKEVLDKLEPENSEFEKELYDYAKERYEKHIEGVGENKLEKGNKEEQEKVKELTGTREIPDELREELKEELKEELRAEIVEELSEYKEEKRKREVPVEVLFVVIIIFMGISGFVFTK